MDRVTFDDIARRTAALLDRRSLFAGLSAAGLAAAGLPSEAGAKGKHGHKHKNNRKSDACKKRVKECRRVIREGCTEFDLPNCDRLSKDCCKKSCQSFDKAQACIDAHLPGQ